MTLNLGIVGAGACLAMPFLCRIPRGWIWVQQYLPSGGGIMVTVLCVVVLGLAASLPAMVVFYAAKFSQRPFYLPFVFGLAVSLGLLWMWHHDNDLSSDAQAAVSLVFIPLYAAIFASLGAAIGYVIQKLISLI